MAQAPYPPDLFRSNVGNLPQLSDIEQPAAGLFKKAFQHQVLNQLARHDTQISDVTGLPDVPQMRQWIALQNCFPDRSSAAAWLEKKRSTIELITNTSTRMDDFWREFDQEAAKVTPAQLLRYRTITPYPGETTAALGQRLKAAWDGVKTYEQECDATQFFLDLIKASPQLRFAVHSKPTTLDEVIDLAVDTELREGIAASRQASKPRTIKEKDMDLSNAELTALAKKRGLSLITTGPKAPRPASDYVASTSRPSLYMCNHHGPNASHDTNKCFVLHPHLRSNSQSSNPPA